MAHHKKSGAHLARIKEAKEEGGAGGGERARERERERPRETNIEGNREKSSFYSTRGYPSGRPGRAAKKM